MPNITQMTPNVQSAVIRPSILSIIRQLQDITGIPQNTRIIYPGGLEVSHQKGSTLTDVKTDEKDRTTLNHDNQLLIEVEESFNENNFGTTAVAQPENIFLFNDYNLGVVISPVYSRNDFKITVRYKSQSDNEIKNYRNSIRTRLSMMRDTNLHSIDYHYGLPAEFLLLLKEIHTLREKIAPYGESIETYLAAYSTTKMTAVTNQGGTFSQLAVAETQNRFIGLFDFNIAPDKPERVNDTSTREIVFTYNVSFDVPIAMNMRYPVMIHNQLLDDKFIEFVDQPKYDSERTAKPMSLDALSYFETTSELDRAVSNTSFINVPQVDTFIPTNIQHDTLPFMSFLCEVDPADRTLLLNLRELGDYEIDSDFLELLQETHGKLTLPYQSFFQIHLYKWSALSADTHIYVDDQLNVRSREPLDLRVNHRVVFSFVRNLSKLSKEVLLKLRRYSKAGRKYLLSIKVTKGDLALVAQKVNLMHLVPEAPNTGPTLSSLQPNYIQFNTVMTGYVVARRRT